MNTAFDTLMTRIKSEVQGLSPHQVQQRLQDGNGILLLDVREREDYAAGYLPGAENLPRGFLELQIEGRSNDRATPILVYGDENQGPLGAHDLQNMGYTDVAYILGGYDAWVESGEKPVRIVASQPPPAMAALARALMGELPRLTPDSMTRPLCPWPQLPRYDGEGSLEIAANFVCR